jgi:hypothetical protein
MSKRSIYLLIAFVIGAAGIVVFEIFKVLKVLA